MPGTESFATSRALAARYAHATPAEVDVLSPEALDRAVGEHDLVVRCVLQRSSSIVLVVFFSPLLSSAWSFFFYLSSISRIHFFVALLYGPKTISTRSLV